MSPRSIYLRDQAAKCEWHAQNIGDSETQVRLRKLAAEYVVQANEIESKKSEAGHRPAESSPRRTLSNEEGNLHEGLPRDDRPA
jgi:hypothetical protein